MQFFTEKEDRRAIFIRHASVPELVKWQTFLNSNYHRCVIVKETANTFVFIVKLSVGAIEIKTQYDDQRFCFKAIQCQALNSIEDSTIEFNKVTHVDRDIEFAIKENGWKYRNTNAVEASELLYDELNSLDTYVVVIEELRRQEEIRIRKEEEDKNASQQLKVWTKYVIKERELLDEANHPFKIASSNPDIKKALADVEIVPQITSDADSFMLEEIAESIGGRVLNNVLEMSLLEFNTWQDNENCSIDAKIKGRITLQLTVYCDGFWDAKDFKEEHGYGREFYYGRFDQLNESIEITYKTTDKENIFLFFERINNSFHFRGSVSPTDAKVTFALQVTITESDDQRKKRIEILSGREFYSKPNMQGVYLGTLSKVGSDKKHIRIILPKDKEQRQIAKEFFRNSANALIYPGLLKDRVLLNRQFDALDKLDTPGKLYNPLLKEFIFNSSRAQATEQFVGLNSEMLANTVEYHDIQHNQMLSLNSSQLEAVVKGLYAKDLCLLQGPPGTGKTTVISELIWQHIRKNQRTRIMLTSQTNLAIDNCLNRLFSNSAILEDSLAWRNIMLIKPVRKADAEKIEEEGLPFSKERIYDWVEGKDESKTYNNIVKRWMCHIAQRVGTQEQYSDILEEWRSALLSPSKDIRESFARQYLSDSNVLCMTCGKVDSADFNMYEAGKGFDVIIVDEASKATLPELLMPLCYARKAIIIGDHRQLPPVIFEDDFFKKIKEVDPELVDELDRQFKHQLVDESLFKRLIMHPFLSPTLKATFNVQYRMHPDINAVISQFYASDAGGLKCGLERTRVDLPNFSDSDSRYHGFSLDHFIRPNVHTIWVDVPDGMEQGGEGSSTFNEKEVEAVKLVLESLKKAEGFDRYMQFWSSYPNIETRVTESKIGVISFYAAQVQKIRNSIQSFCDHNSIKVSTKSVDKFQGQESGIVIVSTVRTRSLGFTRTPERLNVALSRARRLLIIVGNSTFYSSEKAKTDDGQFIYRNVINQIKNSPNAVFIDYRDLKTIVGYPYE